jgi:hypothetical protein
MTAPINAITGYRMFNVSGDRLSSLSARHEWIAGKNKATCSTKGHGPVPARGCGCGFWMYKDLARAAWMFRDHLMPEDEEADVGPFGSFEPSAPVAILAEVRGWGRVLEGDDGWRTQFASVNAILDIGQEIGLSAISLTYNAPIILADIDLSLTHTGNLTAKGEDVGIPQHIGIRLDSRLLVVPKASPAFFRLARILIGSAVEVTLDPTTGMVDDCMMVKPTDKDD